MTCNVQFTFSKGEFIFLKLPPRTRFKVSYLHQSQERVYFHEPPQKIRSQAT